MGPSVRRAPAYDAKADAKALHKAMKGFGCDKSALIKVLCHRSVDQRVHIAQEYFDKYDKKLETALKNELTGDLENVMVALTLPTAEFLAHEINHALTKRNKDVGDVVEICCGLTNEETNQLTNAYAELFGKSLVDEIKEATSDGMENLLVSFVSNERPSGDDVDTEQVHEDVKKLYKAGAGSLTRDELAFAEIMGKRSWAHIRNLDTEYQSTTGHSLKEAVQKEFTGDLQKAFLAVLQCAQNKAGYYAQVVNEAIQGIGTDDRDLIRVIVGRCDIDLEEIKQEFEKMYGKSLASEVENDTSGDYGTALLALIN